MYTNIITNENSIQKIKNTPLGISFYNVTNIKPHRHETLLEIILCLKGNIQLISADQTIELREGDVFSIDCMDIHYLHSQNKNNIIMSLYIDLSQVDNSFEYLRYTFFTCRSDACNQYQKLPMYNITDTLLSIAYIYLSHESLNIHNLTNLYSKLANKLINTMLSYFEWYDYMNTNPNNNTNNISRERFNRILKFCQQNYMNKITVSEIAGREFINENYLSQFLSKSPFQSFSNMINYIRCYQSETFLLTTNLPNIEISYKCGFSDPKYFYKNFKKWYGHTPSEHRNQYIQQSNTPPQYQILQNSDILYILEKHIARYHAFKIASIT